jgi:hypothetical protein
MHGEASLKACDSMPGVKTGLGVSLNSLCASRRNQSRDGGTPDMIA